MKTISIICALLFVTMITSAQQPTGDWDRIWEIKPGYFRVMQNGLTGVVNADGEVLIPCQFDQVYDITDDNYMKVLKNLKIGLYHLEKGMILPAEHDQIWHFEGETAKVLKNRKIGYVNRDGYLVIPIEYNHIWEEEDGLIKVMKDGKMGFLNNKGQIILPVDYQQIWSFEENLAKVLKNGKIGYVDRDGNEVIPTIYDKIFPFEEGKAKAVIGNTAFLIDNTGKIIDDPVEYQPEQQTTSTQTKVTITRSEENLSTQKSKPKKKYFKGHVSSVNMGMNSYVNSNFEGTLPAGYEFMEVNNERSYEVSIYPLQHSVHLIGSQLGLVTSIGMQFNNYRFNLYNSDEINTNETAKLWFQPIPDNVKLDKAKLNIFSLNVPVMLELQLPDGTGQKEIYLSGGIIGSMKLNSHTKAKYSYENTTHKPKLNKDIGINMFRYSYMVKAGYRWLGIYATYSPVSMFKKEKGPELFPYSVGLSINW